jgi:rubrerythrin
MRNFDELSEREMLALAISNEEEDSRIYADFADGLSENYPASAQVFTEMAAEENEHRRRLIDLFASKFGEHIPLIRRQDVRGYIPQKPVWQARPLGIETVRAHAHEMELAAARFYRQATARTSDASIRSCSATLRRWRTRMIEKRSTLKRSF